MPDSVENYVACRICMDSKDRYVSLFTQDLSMKVMEVADVQVEENDGLPASICTDCEQDLEKCYEFRLKVQLSDRKFRENINLSQVEIEECSIKEERIADERNSDHADENNSYSMDEHHDDETEITQEMAPGEIGVDLMSQQEDINEEPPLQRIEEVALDPLVCMKEETETDIMDVDIRQPDPFGPSSSVRNQSSLELNPRPVVSPRIRKTQKFPSKEKEQEILKSDSRLQCNSSNGQNSDGGKHQSNEGYMLIPHQLALDTGLSVPSEPTHMDPNDCFDSLDQTHFTISKTSYDNFHETTLVASIDHSKVQKSLVKNSEKSIVRSRNEKVRTSVKSANKVMHTTSQLKLIDTKKEIEGEDLYFCSVCNIDFGFPDRLEEHKNGKELICCRSCSAIFNDHRELEDHFFSHRKFMCKVCRKIFYVKSDLLHHRDTVLACKKPDILKCRYCYNRFVHKSNLLAHIEVKHPNAETRPFTCNICDSSFMTHKTLREHLIACHTVYESLECDICHKILPGPSSLKTHIKNKHLQSVSAVCHVCNKVLLSKKSLKLHMESHTGEEKVCYICGAVIKGKKTFKTHIYHHENKRRSCSFCNIDFTSQTEKNRHYREKHKTSKSCICEICGKEFKAFEVLRNHMLTHSDEKPYKCNVCGAAFKTKTVLKTHCRVHSDLRKYTCQCCGEAFRWKQTFDKHLLKCDKRADLSNI